MLVVLARPQALQQPSGPQLSKDRESKIEHRKRGDNVDRAWYEMKRQEATLSGGMFTLVFLNLGNSVLTIHPLPDRRRVIKLLVTLSEDEDH